MKPGPVGCRSRSSVINTPRAGFLEKVYENALAQELRESRREIQRFANSLRSGTVYLR